MHEEERGRQGMTRQILNRDILIHYRLMSENDKDDDCDDMDDDDTNYSDNVRVMMMMMVT